MRRAEKKKTKREGGLEAQLVAGPVLS
jgi:hypothetical protein